MNMFGGLLAFLGIYAGSALNALADDVSMMKHSRTVDKDGNIHYIDRLCNEYINNERVKKLKQKTKMELNHIPLLAQKAEKYIKHHMMDEPNACLI